MDPSAADQLRQEMLSPSVTRFVPSSTSPDLVAWLRIRVFYSKGKERIYSPEKFVVLAVVATSPLLVAHRVPVASKGFLTSQSCGPFGLDPLGSPAVGCALTEVILKPVQSGVLTAIRWASPFNGRATRGQSVSLLRSIVALAPNPICAPGPQASFSCWGGDASGCSGENTSTD